MIILDLLVNDNDSLFIHIFGGLADLPVKPDFVARTKPSAEAVWMSETLWCAGKNGCTRPNNWKDLPKRQQHCISKCQWKIYDRDHSTVHITVTSHGNNFQSYHRTGPIAPPIQKKIRKWVIDDGLPAGQIEKRIQKLCGKNFEFTTNEHATWNAPAHKIQNVVDYIRSKETSGLNDCEMVENWISDNPDIVLAHDGPNQSNNSNWWMIISDPVLVRCTFHHGKDICGLDAHFKFTR